MTTLRAPRALWLGAVLLALWASPASSRVVSYAPLTSRQATPAIQKRTNRHVLLVEDVGSGSLGGAPICLACGSLQRAVLYDSKGLEEPRDVTPGGQDTNIAAAAVWEGGDEVPRLFLVSNARVGGDNLAGALRPLFSGDGGATWTALPFPADAYVSYIGTGLGDTGGPICHGRGTSLRVGSSAAPFVFVGYGPSIGIRVYAVRADGSLKVVASGSTGQVFGQDADGRRFLFVGTLPVTGGKLAVHVLDVTRPEPEAVTKLFDLANVPSLVSGWLTPDGAAYLETDWYDQIAAPFTSGRSIAVFANGKLTEIVSSSINIPRGFFTIPTADFSGAWIVRSATGVPTRLQKHTVAAGLVEQWSDITAPIVEALHAGASGDTLLIQVNRPRPLSDQRLFIDPALAIWKTGQPAPRTYDELYLNEQSTAGFVHLDVDAAAAGAPFLFDSGTSLYAPPGGPSGDSGGGSDVLQEWGVVKGSLFQKLVIPASARTSGLFGSQWRTDLVLRNPGGDPLRVGVKLLPNPDTTAPASSLETSVLVAADAILTVPDVLFTLFSLASGSGALLLTPESGRSVEATSRTYTTAAKGTYGMAIGAVDVFAAVGANFPLTYSAGLLGDGFRTNLVATDTSGRGSRIGLKLASDSGLVEGAALEFTAPSGGQVQLNGVSGWLGTPFWRSGSLAVSPLSGETIAGVIAIDNTTNDPTYFPPDLPAPVVRTLPALVHADGVGGARYKTDLYLYNPADRAQNVTLAVKAWEKSEGETILSFTLLPHEARTIRDAYFTAFSRTGVGRLRYQSGSTIDSAGGVRVTSRTYTTNPDGGTYGHLVPPLNSFQSAGSGESVEILGPLAAPGFRTNLALVELSNPFPSGPAPVVKVEILDDRGAVVDYFDTTVPLAGGVQLNDLFRARGLREDLGTVLIRVSPHAGLVAAYATTIDNGTNDPAYFAANLAARF